jgi:hypothetical protein
VRSSPWQDNTARRSSVPTRPGRSEGNRRTPLIVYRRPIAGRGGGQRRNDRNDFRMVAAARSEGRPSPTGTVAVAR